MTKEKTAKTQKQLQALKVTDLQQKAKKLGGYRPGYGTTAKGSLS